MPDNSDTLQQDLLAAAVQCGFDQGHLDYAANLAAMSPDDLQNHAQNLVERAKEKRQQADVFMGNGVHFMQDAHNAEADYLSKRAALVKMLMEVKVSGESLDQEAVVAELQSLKADLDGWQAAALRADDQQRRLFQAEINAAIGPELVDMGFSPEEAAVVVKAVADYALDQDQIIPNVEHAQMVAQLALNNLHNNNFFHQQPGLDPGEQRIQSAARRCLGMRFMQAPDGNMFIARPGCPPLNEPALNGLIGAAKEHVYQNGANAVIGEAAQRQGENIKRELNNRPRLSAGDQRVRDMVARVFNKFNDPQVEREPISNRQGARELIGKHHAGELLDSAIGRFEKNVGGPERPPSVERVEPARRGGSNEVRAEPVKTKVADMAPQLDGQGLADLMLTRRFDQRDVEAMLQAKNQAEAIFAGRDALKANLARAGFGADQAERIAGAHPNLGRAGMNSPMRGADPSAVNAAINKLDQAQRKVSNRDMMAKQGQKNPAQEHKHSAGPAHGYH